MTLPSTNDHLVQEVERLGNVAESQAKTLGEILSQAIRAREALQRGEIEVAKEALIVIQGEASR